MSDNELIELSADIVSAYVSNNTVVASELPVLIAAVGNALAEVAQKDLQPLKEEKVELTQEAQDLIAQREQARAAKDWKKADEIRDKLRDLGVNVQDKKF